MSYLSGGPGGKEGITHEALWGVLGFLRLICGQADQMRIEVPGEDGAEFSLQRENRTVWWQTKRQISSQKTWTLAALEAKNVLTYFAEKAKSGDDCVFASISDAPDLRELSEHAREARDCSEFITHFLGGNRAGAFKELREIWSGASALDSFQWLKRIHVEGGQESTLENHILGFVKLLISGNEHTAAGILSKVYLESVHQQFTRESLLQLLSAKFGINASPLGQLMSSTGVDAILSGFVKITRLLTAVVDNEPTWIARPEEEQIWQRLIAATQPICLLGIPGSGKSRLLSRIAHDAAKRGFKILAIKADLLPVDRSLSGWAQATIGQAIDLRDAVRLAADNGRLLIVIDQLDALANLADLKSGRLNDLLNLIHDCARIPNVSIVCSCREFEFRRDTRLATIDPVCITLDLPDWEQVTPSLTEAGITGAESWPAGFRDILRIPQWLTVYLARFQATKATTPFGSYQGMLDDLWERTIQTEDKRSLVYRLAQRLDADEALWAPLTEFESDSENIKALEADQILQRADNRLGFRHQTLLEHARSRLFTRVRESLCDYVRDRQNAILVRPTMWSVVSYMRGANRTKYHAELDGFDAESLRLHVRYLLIDFLGQVSEPDEHEILLLSKWLIQSEDQLRVLIAIRGSEKWFRALYRSHLPTVMNWPLQKQWPIIGVITAAWEFARAECLKLIKDNWLNDPAKDELTWRALSEIGTWDEEAVDMICKVIERAAGKENRVWWAEDLVKVVSADKPALAPRVFAAAVAHDLARSSLDDSNRWYELEAVAEAAPTDFLRVAWPWFVRMAERFHHGPEMSSVVIHYRGSLFALNDDWRGHSSVMAAIVTAVEHTARDSPAAFVEIVRDSWASDNMPVHRLLARGLTVAAASIPHVGLEYLVSDPRRFLLGDYASEEDDSTALISAVAPHLSENQLADLVNMIRSWSKYRDRASMEECQSEWDRESKLRLLKAIPPFVLPTDVRDFIANEEKAVPEWNRKTPRSRSGLVRAKLPMTKGEILEASDEKVLKLMLTPDPGPDTSEWIEDEECWERPGGRDATVQALRELAKDHPDRLPSLILKLVKEQDEASAASLISALADSALPDAELLALIDQVGALNPSTEQIRSDMGYALYKRSRPSVGLPDSASALLEKCLDMPWSSQTNFKEPEGREEPDRKQPSSVLWGYSGGLIDTDRSFWPLQAATYGYLMRKPAACDRWLALIDRMLDRNLALKTWKHYASELEWIQLATCDRTYGVAVVLKLFKKYPALRSDKGGIRLIADISALLPSAFLQEVLNNLNSSEGFEHRQAFGELLTLISQEEVHDWARTLLDDCVSQICARPTDNEAQATGIAFAAAHLWDDQALRNDAGALLQQLIPIATPTIAQAIGTVFWASDDLAPDENTEKLFQSLAAHPSALVGSWLSDLVEHLAKLLPHCRKTVLRVCQVLIEQRGSEVASFSHELALAGPHLVNIAMTLQRFADTRSDGLALLESLLKLGLDDAFNILNDIDLRPGNALRREPRKRRRRKKPAA
jgi:hypothetical protein